MQFEKALFVFRRDLRLEDNTALVEACRQSRRVFTCFVLDPRQVGVANRFRSMHAIRFMTESLRELAAAVKRRGGTLAVLPGEAESVVGELIHKHRFDAVFFNADYTPFSRRRDGAIARVCRDNGVSLELRDDTCIHAPDAVRTAGGGVYTVFTPFWRRASALPVRRPRRFGFGNLSVFPGDGLPMERLAESAGIEGEGVMGVRGGRGRALAILRMLGTRALDARSREFPAADATTHLSAYLKFGCVSAREVLYAVWDRIGRGHALERQLYWRDFYTHVALHFPRVFGGCFHERFDRIQWAPARRHFDAWREGRTGFPIVDAGMRELAATGWMHNRVRMIVASFLTKDLHIDWRRGERHFATNLVDYDPAVNNGNWQWAASTGCDAQPYFRIFNPWRQQRRFDPEAAYIRRWVPELAGLEAAAIHALERRRPDGLAYPEPIVDHAHAAARAREMYAACR